MIPVPCLNAIATAVPAQERHALFLESLPYWVKPESALTKVRQIAGKAAIERRHTVLENPLGPAGSGAFYQYGAFPSTAERMVVYKQEAPRLACQAVDDLRFGQSGLLQLWSFRLGQSLSQTGLNQGGQRQHVFKSAIFGADWFWRAARRASHDKPLISASIL